MAKTTVAQRKAAKTAATSKNVSAESDVAQKIETDTNGASVEGKTGTPIAVEFDITGHPLKEAKAEDEKTPKAYQYPEGTRLYTYKPKDGGLPIQFPMEFEHPDKVWLWELNNQPFLAQTWAWMRRAGVPKVVQRQAQFLPDEEYPILFEQWFAAMGGGAKPGE